MSSKKRNKKYVPKPVYYPGLMIQVHGFEQLEKALHNLVENGIATVDAYDRILYTTSQGVEESIESSLYVFINYIKIYCIRNNVTVDLFKLNNLRRMLNENYEFDEEIVEDGIKQMAICKDLLKKIKPSMSRDIMASIKINMEYGQAMKDDLSTPENTLRRFEFSMADLPPSVIHERDMFFQERVQEDPEDKRALLMRAIYSRANTACRMIERNKVHI